MEAFRKEIIALALEKKTGDYDRVNLVLVNVGDLTLKDAEIWYKVNNYKRGLITPKDFREYSEDVGRSAKTSTRINFQAVIANKLTSEWLK